MDERRRSCLLIAAVVVGWAFVVLGGEIDDVIAVDIGHTPQAPGAISSRGVAEYSFNRDMVMILVNEMRSKGFSAVSVINEAGDEIDLADRARMAEQLNAQVFISIHHDSVQSHYLTPWEFEGEPRWRCVRFQGFSVFFSQRNGASEESRRLARLVGEELVSAGLSPTLHHAEDVDGERREIVDPERGVYRFDELAVLRLLNIPAVLIECGIIVNPTEEERLTDPAYKRTIAMAVVAALRRFLESDEGARDMDRGESSNPIE